MTLLMRDQENMEKGAIRKEVDIILELSVNGMQTNVIASILQIDSDYVIHILELHQKGKTVEEVAEILYKNKGKDGIESNSCTHTSDTLYL